MQFLLSCEKGKNDTAEVNLPYQLLKISESDTTISFLVSSKSSTLHQSSSNAQFNLLLTEVLISVCPLLDSNVNFITTILNGSTNTSIDTVLVGSRLRSEARGIVVSPLLLGDSLLFNYQFTIRKGVPYLFYNSFVRQICSLKENSPVSNTTIKLNETIAGKNINDEYNQLSNLMNMSFPASNSWEITNTCGTITSSFEFYRDKPVKLLYYPL